MQPSLSREDIAFVLFELLGIDARQQAFAAHGHDRESMGMVLDAAFNLAQVRFAPIAARMDAEEPRLQAGSVVLPAGVGEALAEFRDAGFFGAPFAPEHGGLGLPFVVHSACSAALTAANPSLAGYAFLTIAAANLEAAFATPAQQARYMQPMVEGRFFGTMCLSEPQAGSSLGDVRARAEPIGEGRYRLTGSKMWISGGEHDLAENIVHHVLARIPGGPAGAKGLSLFIVPRRRVNPDGSLGDDNGVRLAGLNHKMGYRGTVNCVLGFGEDGVDCIGELLGPEHQGLACMFHMMNEARIGVGLGAAAIAVAGYRHALAYARERLQGRPLASRDPGTAPVAIIEHADVRRMLLMQKAYAEGGLALSLYAASLVDIQHGSRDDDEQAQATQLLEVLTPLVKAWCSEYGMKANELAIQVLGGYGYTRDYPVERLYRDNRLNPIHEGTNGIQAIDLLGRKVMGDGGAALGVLLAAMRETAVEPDAFPAWAAALDEAVSTIEGVMTALATATRAGRAAEGLGNATPLLELLGHSVVAWLWLRQAIAAQRARAAGRCPAGFAAGKRRACGYFFRWELPRALLNAPLLCALDDSWNAMASEEFD